MEKQRFRVEESFGERQTCSQGIQGNQRGGGQSDQPYGERDSEKERWGGGSEHRERVSHGNQGPETEARALLQCLMKEVRGEES